MKPIHVGLVADPAKPSVNAREMRDLSSSGGQDRVAWDIEVVSEPFTTGCEDVDTALGRLGAEAREHEWDLVVGLTELPLRDDDGRYLLIQADPQRQRAVLSLPALGGLRVHARTRHALRTLVGRMAEPSPFLSEVCRVVGRGRFGQVRLVPVTLAVSTQLPDPEV